MLAEELAVLASTGGTALVTAMVTDGWESVRGRFARLFGRGDAGRTEAAAARLEQSRSDLTATPDADKDQARIRQQIAWKARLEDLLQDNPEAGGELYALVAELEAEQGRSVIVKQQAAAFGEARQAVLGQGVQNVTFGGQHGPAS